VKKSFRSRQYSCYLSRWYISNYKIHKIEHLHAINYIHRDIKPENFLIGLEAKSHILHLVDFGLSKRYRDVKTHQHIAFK